MDLKLALLKTLYDWMAINTCFSFLIYSNCLIFLLYLDFWCNSFILPLDIGCTPLRFLNEVTHKKNGKIKHQIENHVYIVKHEEQ